MGCNCNKSCNCRSVITKQGVAGVQGPSGPAGVDGATGAQGIQGIQGPAGPAGTDGMAFEQYINLDIDYSWTTLETVIPGATHNVGADGDYQVHVSSSHAAIAGVTGTLRLYVNNVLQISMELIVGTEVIDTSIQKEVSMNWRGALLNTQTIELRVIKVTANALTTTKVNMLINKES